MLETSDLPSLHHNSLGQILNSNFRMDDRSYARIYAEELENLKRGYPIFCPDTDIQTGDVGFFRNDDPDEPFERLFNVLYDADHPMHQEYGVPEGFVTYQTFRQRQPKESGRICDVKPGHYSQPYEFRSESGTSREITLRGSTCV
jgi:hypothetical protein